MNARILLLILCSSLPCFGLADRPFMAGPLYSDNSGIRGYGMTVEGEREWLPGRISYDLHVQAANYLTYENWRGGFVFQKFETQTYALEVHQAYLFLHSEAGLKISAVQADSGMLEGFISTMESFFSRTGLPMTNPDRSGPEALRGEGNVVRVHGNTTTRDAFYGLRPGDISISFKSTFLDRELVKAANRLLMNFPPNPEEGNGSFLGYGLHASFTLPGGGIALECDGRAVVPIASRERYGLGLAPYSLGYSLGLEFNMDARGVWFLRFPKASTLGLQLNSSQSPYMSSGLDAFDGPQNDLTFGYSHGFQMGGLRGFWQYWGREDFNMSGHYSNRYGINFYPYAPPDFQTGIKVVFQ